MKEIGGIKIKGIRDKKEPEPPFSDRNNWGIRMVRDKREHIPYNLLQPRSSDDRFKKEVTVFLAEGRVIYKELGEECVRGAFYQYSDRLVQCLGDEKCRRAFRKAARVAGAQDTAQYFEEYLRALLNQPQLEIVHIGTGVNWHSGYPYMVYGYLTPSEVS